MKHVKTPIPADRARGLHYRAGKLIIQAVVSMTILSALLGLGGICLHAALRMDRSDLKDSFLIRSLLRCEQQLRQDASSSRLVANTATSMTFAPNDQSLIAWTFDRGSLMREHSLNGELKSRDRFPFPAGTTIDFQASDNGGVIVRVIEPSDLVKYAEAADGSVRSGKPDDATDAGLPDGAAGNRIVEIRLRGAR